MVSPSGILTGPANVDAFSLISRLLSELGQKVIVAHARQVRLIDYFVGTQGNKASDHSATNVIPLLRPQHDTVLVEHGEGEYVFP